MERALKVLKEAERPLIILGKGAAYAQADEQIRALVEKSGVPYLPMSMAKGLLPDTHPQSAGPARSLVLKEADVVLLIGAGGLLVAATMKYADNIVYSYAKPSSIVVTTVLASHAIFGTPLDALSLGLH